MDAISKTRKKIRGGGGGISKDVRDPLLLLECAFVTRRSVGRDPTMEFRHVFGIFHGGVGTL